MMRRKAALIFGAVMLDCCNLKVFAQSVIDPVFRPRAVQQVSKQGFTHPGILLCADDLNRIQKMVSEGYEPWATAFDQFRLQAKAQKDYSILNMQPGGEGKFAVMSEGYGQYDARRDADAAFAQTVMWYITGDKAYAEKVIRILRLWYGSIQYPSSDILTAGMAMQKFCFAAEVMRYTPGSGWNEGDTKGFSSFLRVMLPSNDKPTAFMNQGGIATMGYMSSGIFLDDRQIYNKAVTRTTVGRESEAPNRDYSIKNQIRSIIDSVSGKEKIVLVEMGRDQGHAQGDIGALGALARTAYIQKTKINPAGDIVTDNSGVNVFRFLNNRLLAGAGIAAAYNLGYDDVFYPVTSVGTATKPGTYAQVSVDDRGELAAVYELIYNHYKYDEKVSDSDPHLKSIKKVVDFYAPEHASEDFPGNGTLLFTPAAARLKKKPKGAPKPLKMVDYKELTKNYGRIQASTFAGSAGNINSDLKHQNFANGDVGFQPVIDQEGTRRIISEIKEKFYVWYTDIDFGENPVDKIIMRSGSSVGCKMDVILLDNLPGVNLYKITKDDLSKGEIIATTQVPATGWWTYFTIFTAQLNKKLKGKHTFALRFYGSGHVYALQATVDWFKFANLSANEDNPAIMASGLINGANNIHNEYICLADGQGITFKDMDFDSGLKLLSSQMATSNSGKIEIRRNNDKGELLASYAIPDTKNLFMRVQRYADVLTSIQGRADVCILYKGPGAIKLKSYRNLTNVLQFEPVTFKNISLIKKGTATFYGRYISVRASKQGTDLNFNRVNFMNTPKTIGFKVRTKGTTYLQFHDINRMHTYTDEPFLKVKLPDTHGQWKIIYTDMGQANRKIKGSQMVIMTVAGGNALFDFAEMQFDPVVVTDIKQKRV